jgi:hypothetical protein
VFFSCLLGAFCDYVTVVFVNLIAVMDLNDLRQKSCDEWNDCLRKILKLNCQLT